ncbi:hypothetical protein B0J18DRAFT_109381 [Chaetomium sp. MPI-SDFR-AT-0129]|nr:hypothetical protein B0J18DRAFT_109381 [Chaetomium sp. MPI-SDFR-AT-0129]
MLAPEWPGWTAPFYNGLGTIPERCECNGWARTWQTVRHNVNDLPLPCFPKFKQRNTPCATSNPRKQLLSQRQCKRETWPATMPGSGLILFAQRNNDGSRLKIKREIGRSRAPTPSSQANNEMFPWANAIHNWRIRIKDWILVGYEYRSTLPSVPRVPRYTTGDTRRYRPAIRWLAFCLPQSNDIITMLSGWSNERPGDRTKGKKMSVSLSKRVPTGSAERLSGAMS